MCCCVFLFRFQINKLWVGPIRVAVALALLFQAVGVSAFAGLGANIVLLPIYASIGARFSRLYAKKMKAQDERVKVWRWFCGCSLRRAMQLLVVLCCANPPFRVRSLVHRHHVSVDVRNHPWNQDHQGTAPLQCA